MKAELPSTPSRLHVRLSLALVMVIMIISSPVVMLANPALVAARSSPQTMDPTSFSVPSTTVRNGGASDFTTQAALSNVNARPSNNIVGVNSYYEVIFTTTTAGVIKFIDVTFPAGTIIGSAPLLLVEKEGIGAGTAIKVSNTQLRYTVTSAVNVPAGTKIRLELFNIVNPILPGSYGVTVTTRNTGGTAIDGPTASTVNTIKQIATGQIADGAITSTKPSESFMKRVTLLDNAGGNAAGWNPDGMKTFFSIAEPDIGDVNSVIIDTLAVDRVCDVTDWASIGVFEVVCSSPPGDGASLHYALQHLPPHVS